MKYEYLLFDIDDTLLDFQKAEEQAFFKTFNDKGIKLPEDMFEHYKKINMHLWKQHEMGLASKDEIMVERYAIILTLFHINADPEEINRAYLDNLSLGHFTINGAKEFLESAQEKFRIFAVSNGDAETQKKRISDSEITHLIERVITSEEAGCNKPKKEFFDYTFSKLNINDKSKVLLIGDSMSADIKGASDYGIDSCWFNIKDKERMEGIVPTYEAKSYQELKDIIYK